MLRDKANKGKEDVMRTYQGIKSDCYEQFLEEASEHHKPLKFAKNHYQEQFWKDVQGFEADDLIQALAVRPEFLEYGATTENVEDRTRKHPMVFLGDVLRFLIWEDMCEEFRDHFRLGGDYWNARNAREGRRNPSCFGLHSG